METRLKIKHQKKLYCYYMSHSLDYGFVIQQMCANECDCNCGSIVYHVMLT